MNTSRAVIGAVLVVIVIILILLLVKRSKEDARLDPALGHKYNVATAGYWGKQMSSARLTDEQINDVVGYNGYLYYKGQNTYVFRFGGYHSACPADKVGYCAGSSGKRGAGITQARALKAAIDNGGVYKGFENQPRV
jgi:hypothetical protein